MCQGEWTESDLCPTWCLRGVKHNMHVVTEASVCVSIQHKVLSYCMCWISYELLTVSVQ